MFSTTTYTGMERRVRAYKPTVVVVVFVVVTMKLASLFLLPCVDICLHSFPVHTFSSVGLLLARANPLSTTVDDVCLCVRVNSSIIQSLCTTPAVNFTTHDCDSRVNAIRHQSPFEFHSISIYGWNYQRGRNNFNISSQFS